MAEVIDLDSAIDKTIALDSPLNNEAVELDSAIDKTVALESLMDLEVY